MTTTISPFSSGYTDPKKPSKYLKLSEGTHLLHFLTEPKDVVSYFVQFVDGNDGKKQKICTPDLGDGNQPADTKRTWAFKVWNYDIEEIQILEVSQRSIQDYLHSIATGKIRKDWTKYPIQITRKGEKMETVYTCMAGDNQAITLEIEKAMANTFVNLQAMATGQDPFDSELVIEPSSKSETVDDTPLPEINLDEMPF
jgi:hypothetical protein